MKQHKNCRVCQTPLGKPYLDLGMQPLANALRTPGDTSEEFRAPLAVALCENCGLSQLTVVVDPDVLYKGYRFRSGTSEAWRKHCADLAEQCGEPGKVLDIAANDCACLQEFEKRGWGCLGVDPAGIPTSSINMVTLPWSERLGYGMAAGQFFHLLGGPYNLVIAQNVLGHVDDPIDFLRGIKAVLAEDGQAVIEVPNVGSLIDDCAFDTIYHEHLSYWDWYSISLAAIGAGLYVENVQRLPNIHGGSVRYWLSHDPGVWVERNAPLDPRPYKEFGQRVSQHINKTAHLVDKASRKGKFVAWGASAKGAVYLNALNNRWPAVGLPEYVIDETAEKVGLLMPGGRIPIVARPQELDDVDVIWVLTWNWLDQIRAKARLLGFKGQFLITSPRPALVD